MGDASVLITPHNYAAEYSHLEVSGIYCVQFVTFRRDKWGTTALDWWRDRCIEWCFGRLEDGKFGDQKYLDDWPERFEGVHVLRHPGAGLAPWSATRFVVRDGPDGVTVDGVPLVFFHFHQVDLLDRGLWPVPACARRCAARDSRAGARFPSGHRPTTLGG